MSESHCMACGKSAKEAPVMIGFADQDGRPNRLASGASACVCDACIERLVDVAREGLMTQLDAKRRELTEKTKVLSDEVDCLRERATVFAKLVPEKPVGTEPIKEQ